MPFQLQGFRELEEALGVASTHISKAFTNIGPSFMVAAEEIISDTLLQAAAQTGPEAFPPAYIEPMLAAASRILALTPAGVAIDFDELGTAQELSEGYHYGAKMEGGGQVDLPWTGGDSDSGLKNDVEVRYEMWLKVFHGETWHTINYAGSWSETIAARLSVWGDKAPQWLLLEYGQEEWEPTIAALPIVETITSELYGLFETMVAEEVEQIIAGLNRPVPVVQHYTVPLGQQRFTTASSGRRYYSIRDIRGRFAVEA